MSENNLPSHIDKSERKTTETFFVVKNEEGQYSIWASSKLIPLGWEKDVAHAMSKEQCLDYIKNTWTDMRPLSLRQ